MRHPIAMEESPSCSSPTVDSLPHASTGVPEATGSGNANAALIEGDQMDTRRDAGGHTASSRSQREEVIDGPEQKRATKACVAGEIVIPQRCKKQDISAW